jgi:hypothetical protein
MKQLFVAISLLSATLLAQSGPSSGIAHGSAPGNGPSYSQTYCSGFITRHSISRASYVIGSKESPHEDRFQGRSLLFLHGALAAGQRYSLVRQIEDPNREDSSPEQRSKFAKLGALYEDVGWVTVKSVEKGATIATFDFSCDAAVPGDLVVPFQERPEVEFRKVEPEMDSFLSTTSKIRGHILGSKDYVALLGTGLTVYTDFGAAKGAKPGDYLVILRGYAPADLNKIDRASEKLPLGDGDIAFKPAKVTPESDKALPNHVLGELLILNVTPDSSTAMITRAFGELELGDVVQQEHGSNSGEEAYEAPANDPAPCRPPSLLSRLLFLSHGCKH